MHTDNNALTYIFTAARLSAIGHHWVSQLAKYTFTIYYRLGRISTEADGLSRISFDMAIYVESCTEDVSLEVVKAILNAVQSQVKGNSTLSSSFSSYQTLLGIRVYPVSQMTFIPCQLQKSNRSSMRIYPFTISLSTS